MPTLTQKLDSMRWRAQEGRWIREWRELYAFAQSAGENGVTTDTLYGDSDYTANCDPNVVSLSPPEELGRDGLGGRYAAYKFPNRLAGFGT